jgi:ATPase subunit of ABC transporter with duplicated ATPase domains
MVTLTDISKRYGGRILFDQVDLQLHDGARYGIVGANGAGKSTLLRILASEESSSTGTVQMPRRARVGVLEQDHFQFDDNRIIDVVMMGRKDAWEAMAEKEVMLEEAERGGDFDPDRFADLEETVQRLGGYELEARAAEILDGLNIPSDKHTEPLRVLSGGYKLRALLGQVLAGEPELLLLDEPTNHLDILSIAWLEKFLQGYKGCAVIVSHDHRFLDNVCTHILDVDYERVISYKGNYTQFTKSKVEERARREQEIEKRKAEIADHRAFIDRFKAKATKARQANSRAKQMAKIELIELPVSSRQHPLFRFPQVRPSGREVLSVKGVWKAYGDHIVLADVTFKVHRGERIAIVGPNGIGKSTLLKALLDRLQTDDGTIEWGYETHPGYFAQDHHEILDKPTASLKSWLWDRVPGQSVGFVHGKLAEVLFGKDDIDKKIENLSGGEGARLVFATLGVQKPNVLVLDEPTNHLDLEGIESLANGLKAFEGTVLFVSHDRWFVENLATRVIDLREDGITDFKGPWLEYLAAQEADRLSKEVALEAERQRKRAARQAKAGGKSAATPPAKKKPSSAKKKPSSAKSKPARQESGGKAPEADDGSSGRSRGQNKRGGRRGKGRGRR